MGLCMKCSCTITNEQKEEQENKTITMSALDEYIFSTYVNDMSMSEDERALSWGNRHYYYEHKEPYPFASRNSTAESEWPDNSRDALTTLRALFGFILAIILYFCVLCYFCRKQRDASKKEVDKSIITKRVLPHGQSQLFGVDPDEEISKTCCSRCLTSRCWCKRKQKQAITPAAESAEAVLAEYRSKSSRQQNCAHCNSVDIANNEIEREITRTNTDDELQLAEEGLGTNNNEICPICITPFLVGEQVTWSSLGQCKHVYHYACILPWAVLGNVTCPVCRETFWTKNSMQLCSYIFCHRESSGSGSSASDMRRSRFCVRHGLVSPQEV